MKDWLFAYIEQELNTIPEFPWEDSPDAAVFRHTVGRKWFALVMRVSRERLHLPGQGDVDVMNVKCDPKIVSSLRDQPGFRPAYHMNKEHWLTILLDGSVDREQVITLLTMSYDLTARQGKKC